MDPSTLEARLAALLNQAREAWPEIELDAAAFIAHVENLGDINAADPLRGGDLALAWGCAQGLPAAVDAFRRTYGAEVAKLARRFASPRLPAEDLQQQLWEKLLVRRGERPPKIAEYRGEGFLQNWLRVTAIRTFLDAKRQLGRTPVEESGQDERLLAQAGETDPELAFLKRHYRAEFHTAFAAAVASLESRDRNLLRHSAVSGLSIDQIATLYHIHRATAARRLERARQRLLQATRAELMKKLRVGRDEFESIMALIQSRLHVSLHRLLKSQAASPTDKEGLAAPGEDRAEPDARPDDDKR